MGIETNKPADSPLARQSLADALVERLPKEPVPIRLRLRDDCYLINQRLGQDHASTIGVLLLAREIPGCSYPPGESLSFILEDRFRAEKVKGETRIPAGYARMTRVKQSGILGKMRKWFPEMEWIVGLEDVPNYELLRVHTGVKHEHTDGCPLTGGGVLNAWKTSPTEASLTDSRNCYRAVHEQVLVPLFEHEPEPRLLTRDEGFLLEGLF